MWCPKCRNEYVAGVTVCADCGSKLVDELPSDDNTGIDGYDSPDHTDLKEDADAQESVKVHTYVKKDAVYEDAKSTTLTFLTIGVIGLVFIILFITGVIQLNMAPYMKVLMSIVMGSLFVIFIGVGLYYLKRLKYVKQEMIQEEDDTKKITEWFKNHCSAEAIDNMIENTDIREEQLYFMRYEILQQLVTKEFPDLDESYQDHMLEQLYNSIF